MKYSVGNSETNYGMQLQHYILRCAQFALTAESKEVAKKICEHNVY